MIYYRLSPNKHFKVNSFHPEEYANIFPDVFSLWGSAGVVMNRKVLSDMAINDAEGFAKLAELAKTKLA